MKLLPSLLLLTLTTVAVQAFAQDAASEVRPAPFDTATLPVPLHQSGVKVAMRDGAELALEIYRPAQPGAYPTLLAVGPYLPGAGTPDNDLTGPVRWLVSQGYNYVLANVRGTGTSTGHFEFMDREEQQDLYELVEWVAQQPWSDSQVAGIGADYYGSSQWFMAIQNPPHLSCIAPLNAVLDPYRDWAWHGGLANAEFVRWYEQEIREAHAYPAQGQARYLDFDLRLQQLEHNMPDAWWAIRSPAAGLNLIRVPVLQLGTFSGSPSPWLAGLALLGSMPSGTHTYISAEQALLQNRSFLEQELLPWYQWCFSGKPASGPALLPPLRYKPGNSDELRSGSSWPPANINFTALLLQASTDPGAATGSLVTAQGLPGRNRSELGAKGMASAVFRTAPLQSDVDFAGPLQLELHISSDATDTAFVAELYEEELQVQFPDSTIRVPSFLEPEVSPEQELRTAGREVLISTGVLKASRRALSPDSNSSSAYSYGAAELLYPGRVYRLDLALDPAARRLKAGSRLLLKIRQTSDASLRRSSRTDTLYHSPQFPSRLWLPLAANANLGFVSEAAPEPTPAPADKVFILDSFIPEAAAESPGQELSPEAQLADELFNSEDPVILLP